MPEVRADDVGDHDRAVVAVRREDRPDRRDVGLDRRPDLDRSALRHGQLPASAMRAGLPNRAIISSSRSWGRAWAVIAVAAGHRLGRDQRVDDRLLGRLDRRRRTGASITSSFDRPDVDDEPRVARERRLRQRPVAGREAQEQVAARVAAGAAHPGDAEARPLGEPLALVGQQRRVGRDDDDDRARAGAAARSAVRRRPRRRSRRARDLVDRDRLADRARRRPAASSRWP